nr:protein SUPPRESSOR OF GENE SILENCING 3-like [Ipomoea batatas]
MSSSKGGGKPFYSPPTKKTSAATSNLMVDQLNCGVADLSFKSKQDDGQEVYVKKPKSRAGKQPMLQASTAKVWGNSGPKAWGHPTNTVPNLEMRNNGGRGSGSKWQAYPTSTPAGRGNVRPQSANRDFGTVAYPPPVVQPPLKWSTLVASTHSLENDRSSHPSAVVVHTEEEDDDEQSYLTDESDDDFLSDEFDSCESEKSHDTRKQNRWFQGFFNCINSLSTEQINDPGRQWHCPACKGGPGAIDWYRGLYSLTVHARTKRSKRMKLHRELAEVLEEELSRRGTSVVQAGEIFRKWNGLANEEKDFSIVWPPMVIIMNTRHEKDENDKWIGMGNQELLDYFSFYDAVKARHSYGPKGHRGMSILIFDASPVGYLEAERLSKHFTDDARDRDAWERNPITFFAGGKRQLYGYMAEKRDIDDFNRHSQGKSRLRFEILSHREMVVDPLKKMGEDNQQLMHFKDKAARHQKQAKALEESVNAAGAKLRQTLEETKVVRLRIKKHHEENKDEMDFQGEFFKETFEKMQREHFDKDKQSHPNNLPSVEDHHLERVEEIAKYGEFQNYGMKEFIAEKEKLKKAHEEEIDAMRRRHREEEAALDKKFELAVLMEKYTPPASD